MKGKRILVAALMAFMLTAGVSFAATSQIQRDTSRVTTYNISESAMWSRLTDRSRTSVYIQRGSNVTEYHSNHSGKTAAEDIYAALGGTGSEIMTQNTVIVGYLKGFGAREVKTISTKGIKVYVLRV